MSTSSVGFDLTVKVENGPQIAFSDTEEVKGIDALDIEVPVKTTTNPEKEVNLQPSEAKRVKFLLIKPKKKLEKEQELKLKYRVSNGTDWTGDILLNKPHLYFAGMITLFTNTSGPIDPKILKFTNESNKPIAIEILVGRDPVIPPSKT